MPTIVAQPDPKMLNNWVIVQPQVTKNSSKRSSLQWTKILSPNFWQLLSQFYLRLIMVLLQAGDCLDGLYRWAITSLLEAKARRIDQIHDRFGQKVTAWPAGYSFLECCSNTSISNGITQVVIS
jgi:hypothetical protein